MSACINNDIVSLDEFNNYSGNFEDTCEAKKLKVQFLKSAQSVVEEYLGYSLSYRRYIESHIGWNNNTVFLDRRPIIQIYNVFLNGRPLAVHTDYIFDSDALYLTGCTRLHDFDKLTVDYDAGYQKLPDIIKTTILRIATLMLMEAGENIGVTGKSLSDGNSRSFINYSDYSKYLKPISNLRTNLL